MKGNEKHEDQTWFKYFVWIAWLWFLTNRNM